MLSIRLGDHLYSLPSKQVRHIGCVDSLTVLPMMPSWIEGLVYFNGLPILLIDAFDVLGLEQRSALSCKCIFIHYKHMDFAFRVDEVLRTKKNSVQNNLPSILTLLELKKRLPLQVRSALIKPTQIHYAPQASLSVLVLVSGDKTLALSSHQIDSIRRIDPLPKTCDGDVLIKLDDQLIPAHSLGQLLALQTTGLEVYAVIIKGKERPWALCVEHLQGLETIEQIYVSSAEPHSTWQLVPVERVIERMTYDNLVGFSEQPQLRYWYTTHTGSLRELLNIEHLLEGHYHPHSVSILMSHTQNASAPISKQQVTLGLQFFCGTESYFVPLTMVDGVLEAQYNKNMARTRPVCAKTHRSNQTPKLDSGLLFGVQQTASSCILVLRLADDVKLMLAVDRVLLSQAKFIDERWVNFNFPDPLAFFFDAAYYDELTKKWILRLRLSIHFAVLPWQIKKTLVKAIQGWC